MNNKRYLKRILDIITILWFLIVFVVFVHVVSMLTFDRIIEYKSVPFHSAKLPLEMNGYKIAFVTDTHEMKAQELEKVVLKLNKIQADLLILGGDFAYNYDDMESTIEILSRVSVTDGIYGIEGNHDVFTDLFPVMKRFNICPLSNSGVHIRDNFYLAGVKDLWNRSPDIEKAIEGAQDDDFIVLVAHNPDTSMKQDTSALDLILSGHTHGGHMTLFGLWAPALTRFGITDYGHRFMSGWSESRDGTPVYVSNGTGSYVCAPRVFARPQVIIFTLFVN